MDSPSQSRHRKRRRHHPPGATSAADAADAADLSPCESISSLAGPSSSKRPRDHDADLQVLARSTSPEQHRHQPVASTSTQPMADDHSLSAGPSNSASPNRPRPGPTFAPLSLQGGASKISPLAALPPAERGPRAAMRLLDQEASRNAISIDDDDDQGRAGGSDQLAVPSERAVAESLVASTDDQSLIQKLRAELEAARKEVKAKDELIESQRSTLNYIHGQASCTICLELAWRPHLLSPCGHVFCARCLVDWFQRPQSPDRGGDGQAIDNDVALAREKICPHCRSFVRGLPAEVWALKGMVERLDAVQQLGHILPDGPAAHAAPRSAVEEARMRGDDLPPGAKIWEPFFEADGQREPVMDEADGVWRCGNCSSEIWKRECTGCGRNHHAFFVSRGIFYEDGDDSEEYEWDEGLSEAGTFTSGNLHGPESPGPWMDAEHATPHLGIPYDPEEEEDAEEDDGSDLDDFIDDDDEDPTDEDAPPHSTSHPGGGRFLASLQASRRRYGYSDEEDDEDEEDAEFTDEHDDDDDADLTPSDEDEDDEEGPVPRSSRRLGRTLPTHGSTSASASTSGAGSSRRPIQVPDDLDTDESDSDDARGEQEEDRWVGSSRARKPAPSRRRGVQVIDNSDEDEDGDDVGDDEVQELEREMEDLSSAGDDREDDEEDERERTEDEFPHEVDDERDDDDDDEDQDDDEDEDDDVPVRSSRGRGRLCRHRSTVSPVARAFALHHARRNRHGQPWVISDSGGEGSDEE